MRSTRRVRALQWLLPLCASSAVAAPPDGRAAEEPIRLEYRPAAGCPSNDALVSNLRASTTRFRFAGEGEPARSFAIDAEQKPGAPGAAGTSKYAGRLTIRDVSGQTAVREVSGATCAEAVAALAFVAALAIDPNAVPAAAAKVPPGETPTPNSPVPSSAVTGAEAAPNLTPPPPILAAPAATPSGQPVTLNAPPDAAQAP